MTVHYKMSGMIEQHVQVRELIHAAEVIGFHGNVHDRHSVTPALIEAMKREVDRQIRIDAGQALKLADVTYELSTFVADPLTRALGLRARAQALHVLGRYESNSTVQPARSIVARGDPSTPPVSEGRWLTLSCTLAVMKKRCRSPKRRVRR
jgi:hypothetical protein